MSASRKRELESAADARFGRGVRARLEGNAMPANTILCGGGDCRRNFSQNAGEKFSTTKSLPIFIYVLRLEGGNYYVGKTEDAMKRYQEHLDGHGSAWTRKYKPLGIDKIQPNSSDFDEDKITKEYMSTYGIDKVRGGAYVEVQLSPDKIDLLTTELRSASNLCTRCGRADHFVKNCPIKLSPKKADVPKTELQNASNLCTR